MIQAQMFYHAHKQLADRNAAMLDALYGENPITDKELQALIKKRPGKYGMFSGYLGKRVQQR